MQEVALLTDGRFCGGSHGFVVGHICPEAQEGGPIGLIKNGDVITIDIQKRRMDVKLTDAELNERRNKWTPPPYRADKGVLYKVLSLFFFFFFNKMHMHALLTGRDGS